MDYTQRATDKVQVYNSLGADTCNIMNWVLRYSFLALYVKDEPDMNGVKRLPPGKYRVAFIQPNGDGWIKARVIDEHGHNIYIDLPWNQSFYVFLAESRKEYNVGRRDALHWK